ncbi:hypothetical protein J3R30DRAFT_555786 [Lentinula aciculospora]|uniref:Uncharacterized protein n=1 Tax=Lentinula aciculospora TaxID=153920 RepID=A0A9W9A7L8_9AGAR|nr:hypothetical protein J3R30DRAFT_555786 [Lentinula aciculospora]
MGSFKVPSSGQCHKQELTIITWGRLQNQGLRYRQCLHFHLFAVTTQAYITSINHAWSLPHIYSHIMYRRDSNCPDVARMGFDSLLTFQLKLSTEIIMPIAFDLLLYGIFIGLFGLSIHIFRRKFTPGKSYIVTTIVFFTLATASIVIELVSNCIDYSLSFSIYSDDVGSMDFPSTYPFQIALDLLFPFAWSSFIIRHHVDASLLSTLELQDICDYSPIDEYTFML